MSATRTNLGIKSPNLGVDFLLSKTYNFSNKYHLDIAGENGKIFERNTCSTYSYTKEYKKMTSNEKRIIELIRKNENPRQAGLIALEFLTAYSKALPARQAPVAVLQQGRS